MLLDWSCQNKRALWNAPWQEVGGYTTHLMSLFFGCQTNNGTYTFKSSLYFHSVSIEKGNMPMEKPSSLWWGRWARKTPAFSLSLGWYMKFLTIPYKGSKLTATGTFQDMFILGLVTLPSIFFFFNLHRTKMAGQNCMKYCHIGLYIWKKYRTKKEYLKYKNILLLHEQLKKVFLKWF